MREKLIVGIGARFGDDEDRWRDVAGVCVIPGLVRALPYGGLQLINQALQARTLYINVKK